MTRKMAVVQFCILAPFVASKKISSMYNMYPNMIMLDDKGNYNVSYNYNESADTLEFMVQVRTTGWVGFGIAEVASNNMSYYDVAIGGVTDDGTSYLQVGRNDKSFRFCLLDSLKLSKKQEKLREIRFYISRPRYYVLCLTSLIFPLKSRH